MASALDKHDSSISISINAGKADGYILLDDNLDINSINQSKFIILQDHKSALRKLPLLCKHNIWKPTHILDLPTNIAVKSLLPKNFIITYTTNPDLRKYAAYKDQPLVFLNLPKNISKSQWSKNWKSTNNIADLGNAKFFLTVSQNQLTPYELRYFAGIGVPIHSTYVHPYLKEGINCVISKSIKENGIYLRLRDSALYYESVVSNSFENGLENILADEAENINIKDHIALEKPQEIIYLAPNKIPRIKDSQHIYADNLLSAIDKLHSLAFGKAYIFDVKMSISDQEKSTLRKSLLKLGEKANDIYICVNAKLPYFEGLSVITKIEGLKQNIL